MAVDQIISQFLDTTGDGTGTFDASGDYSVTPATFKIEPPANRKFFINRLLVCLSDTGTIDADGFGNGPALTNGIVLREQSDAGTRVDFTAEATIKRNAQWGAYCFDVDVKTWGTGDEILVARWTFGNSGTIIELNGDAGDRFEVVLNDDLSGLNEMTFMVQGFRNDVRG